MSAANGNAPKVPKGGDDAKKDDTIVKVTGAAIATGIAFSLYKSFFAGKNKELHAEGYPKSEPFHEQISIDTPDELKRFGDGAKDKGWRFKSGAKDKAGQLRSSAEDFKDGVGEKAGDVKDAIGRKGQETKEWLAGVGDKVKGGVEEGTEKAKRAAEDSKRSAEESGERAKRSAEESADRVKEGAEDSKDYAKEKSDEAKNSGGGGGGGWWPWGKKDNKAEDEARKAKEEAERAAEDSKRWADDKGNKLGDKLEEGKRTVEDKASKFFGKAEEGKRDAEYEGSKWADKAKDGKNRAYEKERGFFDKAGNELRKDKDNVTNALYGAEKKLERGAAAVADKVTHPFGRGGHGGDVRGDARGAGDRTRRSGGGEYLIKRGDTLWSLSKRYGTTIDEFKVANSIWDPDYIVAGDTLTIPK